jgi:hypothetical protein
MTRPEFLGVVQKVMTDARQVVKGLVLPYDGLVSELTEQGIPEETVHLFLFEATMAGELSPYWRHPDLNTLNFALIPKEDSQCPR